MTSLTRVTKKFTTQPEILTDEAVKGILLVGYFPSRSVKGRNVIEGMADHFRLADVPVVCASAYRWRWARGLDILKSIVYQRQRYNVAVVDLYSGRAFTWGLAATELLTSLKCPYVVALHGGSLPVFAKRHASLVRRCLRGAAAVVSPSPYLKFRLQAYRQDICLLPNALDVESFRYRLRESSSPRLVWVRAFHKIYRPWLAAKVVARLAGDFPEIQLTMIGPDTGDGSLARTQRAARELGVIDRISFPGPIPNDEVPEWLQASDIFVNTTDVDNTPVSVMEAMAAGLCVVTTDAGGLPDLVENNQDALLVPQRDENAMAAAVRRILTDDCLSARLSRAARQKAERWDWSEIMPQWFQLLEGIAQGNSGPGRGQVDAWVQPCNDPACQDFAG